MKALIKTSAVAGVAAAVAGAAVAASLLGAPSGTATGQPLSGEPVASTPSLPPAALWDFPTNAAGLTFGSLAKAGQDGEAPPDLIRVTSDEGLEGYVLTSDFAPVYSSPSEVAEASRAMHPGGRTILVFDQTGQKVIGTFTLQSAETSN